MMTKTLIGLACLIANRAPSDAEKAVQKLEPGEQAQVQAVIDSGVCLPSSFEDLLIETRRKVERGELPPNNPAAAPSEGTFDPKM
jgi:hypothetical protein